MDNLIEINPKGADPYNILIRDSWNDLGVAMASVFKPECRICVISDINVSKLYGDELVSVLSKIFKQVDLIELKLGEINKSLETVSECYSRLIALKYGRNDVIVALGGGICGDIAGFVASSYMRGIGFVQVPTTLLSMVDSSSGGKTGVNFEDFKNMIGAFKMPRLVYIKTSVLKTLPEKEYSSGMAEVLKAGLIKDGSFYEWLINSFQQINEHEDEFVSEMIARSIAVKKFYVEKDPYEKNERAILNFGHTVGHALEKYTDFKYSHGECVALGSVAAAYISWKKDYLTMEEFYEIRDMFVPFGLPISLPDINIDRIIEYMRSDKKNTSDGFKFILLKKIGKGMISTDVTEQEIREAIDQINYV